MACCHADTDVYGAARARNRAAHRARASISAALHARGAARRRACASRHRAHRRARAPNASAPSPPSARPSSPAAASPSNAPIAPGGTRHHPVLRSRPAAARQRLAHMAPIDPSPNRRRSQNKAVKFLSGATSGCLSTVTLQPLDVLKTRMQMSAAYSRTIHLKTKLKVRPNAGAIETISAIATQDGAHGLWRGVVPSVLRNAMSVGCYMMLLDVTTSRLAAPDGTLSDRASFLAGGSSRLMTVLLLSPMSVVKTRMETVEYSAKYNGTIDALTKIAKQEGRQGLYRGLIPSIMRDVPYSATYMFLYLRSREFIGSAVGLADNRSVIVRKVSQTHKVNQTSPGAAPRQKVDSQQMLSRVVTFASGGFSGGLATLLTQPLDVAKTRIQLSTGARGAPSRYSGFVDAVHRTWAEEGAFGFFRGSVPRFVKRIMGAAITWMVFEECNTFYATLLTDKEKDR
ncbi:Mitochondrial carrier [Gracilaria domingensis]|nr:Mitochondrial carrier [Gracilaria domingensis]